MNSVLYMAWRYLAYHPFKTVVLVVSIALILFIPVGLRVMIDRTADELTQRAGSTPLVVGAKGSPLELVLNTLYFKSNRPEPIRYEQARRAGDSGLATPIPMYVRFRSRGHPIVGTTLDYFEFRRLRVAAGEQMAMLGECVLGAEVARDLGVGPGGHVVSSPENVFDLAGVYPLKMRVKGVLARSHGPDDGAIFVDVKTAWIIEGLAHGHEDLSRPEAAPRVLRREGSRVIGNASVVQYNEITAKNADSFHFHGDPATFPITAIIAVPRDEKSGVILRGRYGPSGGSSQAVVPLGVMEELLATILTVRSFVIAAMVIVGAATLATAGLVFLLSVRLRRREIETMVKIGASRMRVATILGSEIVMVLLTGIVLAGGLTLLAGRFGASVIRGFLL
jgi:putative ABC transport system permease protein